MLTDVGGALVAVLAMLTAIVSNPTNGECPKKGWYVDGVSADGHYQCFRMPIGDDVRLPNGHVVDHSIQPAGVLDGRIFCQVGATVPIVIDYRTVACAKGTR
jgi:hypothetical protein